MATLVLQAAGSALGSAFGGPMLAAVGQAAGAALGSMIDRSLMGGPGKRYVEGPRLKTLDGISATEGAPIPRIYGRVRLGGQVIWATRFEEQAQSQRSGKSGGKSAAPKSPQTVTTTYSYFANLAVALCEGPIAMVRRVWADGKLLDLTGVTMRVYTGSETQEADPLIVARQGESPAYRGMAYVVFERLPLEAFGNRLPQLAFEVVRPVGPLSDYVRGVDLIPGASEFAYHPAAVSRTFGRGGSQAENRNQLTHVSDFEASLDALEAVLPKAKSIALVSSWFGNDLRAGSCLIRPAVDNRIKTTVGAQWSVAGETRATAPLVTEIDGRAAYGGTPSDETILAAIAELKARGLSVVFYPFVMMDVAPGNTLPNPYTGMSGQPEFPWRGRLTLSVAPGRAGSPDGTAAAGAEVASLFGTASAADFSVSGGTITYTGPQEWGLRRMVLHNAALCKAAGGVDAFIIGSEFVGLTRIRSASGVYPAVAEFRQLAAEVRALLGPAVKIGYAADWTEYGAHVLDGGVEIRFPLDPLWSDTNIDFVGIDFYPPVSDWRDGEDHADRALDADGRSVAYLAAGLAGGEAFDWYYSDVEARQAQTRSPITDGAYGKPWIFRAKDLKSWWQQPHVERFGGVEISATGWQPQSKPIWLTEVGCPAVDKGCNAPNLFPDIKSSESALPPFSSGARDDLVQARFLEAVAARFDPGHPAFVPANNPASPLYGGRMVDPARIHVWAWDARPFPAFPHMQDVWGDGANWQTGHWLNGRAEGAALDRVLSAIAADFGLPEPAFDTCEGFVDGYVVDRPMSARAAMEPLLSLFSTDVRVSAGMVRFSGRSFGSRRLITREDLVPDRKGQEVARTRAQETELPRALTLGFSDAESQYQRAAVSVAHPSTASRREQNSETTAVLRRSEARRLAEIALQEQWSARETVTFSLRPGLRALEPGDVVSFDSGEPGQTYRIKRVADGTHRTCEAQRIGPRPALAGAADEMLTRWSPLETAGPPHLAVLHLPVDPGEPTPLAWLGVAASPWKGPYTLWREAADGSFDAVASIDRPVLLGETVAVFNAGPLWRWDERATLRLRLDSGALSSPGAAGALSSRQPIAVQGADGLWEIVAFRTAVLGQDGVWTLSGLLRGLAGSEAAAGRNLPAGAPVAVLDNAVIPALAGEQDVGASTLFRISPQGQDYAGPGATTATVAAGVQALKPLAPVHVRARRSSSGVHISFCRRARRGGDNWNVADVPLAEDLERYRITIRNGATAVRTLTVSESALLYPASDEMSDFGSPRTSLELSIAQISRIAGESAELSATIPVFPGA